jgi:hypothetical protein
VSRVIGILGAAHSGSTALGLVLGGLPGVRFVGEDHYLARLHTSQEAPLFPCASCGDACPVFTPGVVQSAKVRATETPGGRWWPFLSHAVGSPDVIVSSNKRPVLFERFGLPDLAIILYRDCGEWSTSWCKKHRNAGSVEEAEDIWVRLYGRVRTWCRTRRVEHISVNWSDVRKDPPARLARLAEGLGLRWTDAALNFTGRHHVQGYADVGEGMKRCA